jgi:signal peptidase II
VKFVIFLVSVLVVLADQSSKAWVSLALAGGLTVPVAPGLAWELSHNDGAAFGMLGGMNLRLIVPAAAAVVFIVYWAWKVTDPLMAAGLGLLLGGAIGNLIDRVRLGHVVDFIAIQSGGRTIFPNFNVADSAITVGACLVAYAWFRAEQKRDHPKETRQMASTGEEIPLNR